MTESLRVGARDSQLSLLQAKHAIAHLQKWFGDALSFSLIPFSSPGDRNLALDLRESPEDFFTRDLDEALRQGEIDCAIHSAKDLPQTLQQLEGDAADETALDWVWLPWREDPRDCLISTCPHPKTIGISSTRRADWAARIFPNARQTTLRGTIPERLRRLDAGDYDAIVVAAAALHRLGLQERISAYIPLDELTPPPGQGVLALTFRRQDRRLQQLRNLFIKAVRFVGAGVGDAELCTIAGLRELKQADCVIYDALMDEALVRETPGKTIYVGKRSGAHALPQAEITRLIGQHVRRGERVVRLKGGDPGLFGRLAEETEALVADGIPFRVWPGVSALAAATTATGLLLTRRGESKGFRVETPRSTGTHSTDVYFMGLARFNELAKQYSPDTPCAIVYNAGAPTQQIQRGTVSTLQTPSRQPGSPIEDQPAGLILVGAAATTRFPALGPLAGRKVWVTGSPDVAANARTAIVDFGGVPVLRPLIRFEAAARVKIRPSKAYTHLLVTSPTAARFLLSQLDCPIQFLPKRLLATGPGTAHVLAPLHLNVTLPTNDFSSRGLLTALPDDLTGWRILRVRSEEAGSSLAEALKTRGARVKDLPIYRTLPIANVQIPPYDAVFLASSSAAKAWLAQDRPHACDVLAMGNPTAETLRNGGIEPTLVAPVQTVQEVFCAYARHCLSE